jgi:Ca2+:H+ antiporter
LKSHHKLFEAEQAARQDGDEEEEEEVAEMDTWSAGFWLAAVTVVTAFSADVLVASIDETASKWSIPKP